MLKLENNRLKIKLQTPGEEYRRSRYDWSSFITDVILDDQHSFVGVESKISQNGSGGKGLCGEFCMENPPGYVEAKVGDYFIKIGVGLAQKTSLKEYCFAQDVDIKPILWNVVSKTDQILLSCEQENNNGYAYKLTKKISLQENNLVIDYQLVNTGDKDIITQEYNHNYLYLNGETIGKNYELRVNFDPEFTRKTKEISYNNRLFTFGRNVRHTFFCEDRTTCVGKIGTWALANKNQGLYVQETLSAPLWKFAVFGKSYAVCPELFADINAPAGETFSWQRKWTFEEDVEGLKV